MGRSANQLQLRSVLTQRDFTQAVLQLLRDPFAAGPKQIVDIDANQKSNCRKTHEKDLGHTKVHGILPRFMAKNMLTKSPHFWGLVP